jgi:heme/copper-type cytochrome/quinol oxidase subunit 2
MSRVTCLFVAFALAPCSMWACAACYGQSDSPLAQGLNWGIMSLLGVVVGVLGSFAAFFVYLAKRSALPPETSPPEPLLASAKEIPS